MAHAFDRRRALLAAATLWPAWLARGFGPRSSEAARADDLQRGIERARRLGKPLVVFVVPNGPFPRIARGRLLGRTLRFGGDELLADLALAEIVCARLIDVVARFPGVLQETEAQFFVVSTEGDRPSIAVGFVAVEAAPSGLEPEEYELAYRRWARPLSLAWSRALVGDGGSLLAARAASSRDSLDASALERVERAIAGASVPDDALLERAAALFRTEAERSRNARELWMPALTRVGRTRWLQGAPPGSRWASFDGAGVTVEPDQPTPVGEEDEYVDDSQACPSCGMGMIPEISRRFLFLLARGDRP